MKKPFAARPCAAVLGVFALLALFSCGGGAKKAEAARAAQALAEEQAQAAALAEEARLEAERLAAAEDEKRRFGDAVSRYVESLSQKQLIAQLFAVGIDGDDILHSYAKAEFADAAPGAFLLFGANIAPSAAQVGAFTRSVSQWFLDEGLVPPLLMIDNEGGLVYRLEGVASPLPSAEKVARLFAPDEARAYYALVARQMRALGMHVNLAPLVESARSENRAFLGSRSYGDLQSVALYAGAAVAGFESNGVAATLKHFPGNTNVDPHEALPHLQLGFAEFEEQCLKPFELLLASEPKPSAVLMSHIVVDCIERDTPACFSSELVRGVLRGRLGFDGVVISDDLYMGALAQSGFPPERAVVQAVRAGVNVLMLSEKRYAAAYNALAAEFERNGDFAALVRDSVAKIVGLKVKLGLLRFDGEIRAAPLSSEQAMAEEFAKAKGEADAMYSALADGQS